MATTLFVFFYHHPQLCSCFPLPSPFRLQKLSHFRKKKKLEVKEKGGGHDKSGKGKCRVIPLSSQAPADQKDLQTFATICIPAFYM